MKNYSYRLDRFDEEGMKIVTSNAGLVSLSRTLIQLAGIDQLFSVNWLEITDSIPTVHFDLPDDIDFNAFMVVSIEHLPDTGEIRKLYFMRRMMAC